MAKMKRCPICSSTVKPENLARHLKKVHPGEEAEGHIAKDRKARARGGVSRREGAVFAAIALAIAAIVLLAFVYRGPPDSMVGDPAPSFTIRDVETRLPYSVPGSFRNELVFVEFFSPTCGACINFIPTMVQLSQDFSLEDVNFISIDVKAGDTEGDVIEFLNAYPHPEAQWTHSLDTSNIADAYNVKGTPKLFIIDLKEDPENGIVRYDHTGIDTYGAIASKLNELLNQ
ncbi:MAG: TlpA family protein disulfide reductase [Thermoplasmata archaeon]